MGAATTPILLGLLCGGLLACVLAQVNIQENYDGYHRVAEDPDVGTKEIYTSMHQLREFFDAEKEYVNDIRQMMEKKLVSQKAVGTLGILLWARAEIHRALSSQFLF